MAAFNFLFKVTAVSTLTIFSFALASCGGGTMSSCNISTSIVPMNATADHTAASPGNQGHVFRVVQGFWKVPDDTGLERYMVDFGSK